MSKGSDGTVSKCGGTVSEGSDGTVSKCPVFSPIMVLETSNTAASDVSLMNSSVSGCLPQSSNTSSSSLAASCCPLREHSPQCSVSSQVSTHSVLTSQQLDDTKMEQRNDLNISNSDVSSGNISGTQQFPTTNLVHEQNDLDVLNSDASDDIISDLSQLPITNQFDVDCQMQEQKDFDILNSDVPVDNDSNCKQLPITNQLELECQVQEQKSNSEGPSECISDELIVSQILAADSSQSKSLDDVFVYRPSTSNCTDSQNWREMLSPVIGGYHFSTASEENSDHTSLSDVGTVGDACLLYTSPSPRDS